MVLEKTLESPLDCKEIKSVNHKGNQSLTFVGRTVAKATLQYFGHLMWRTDSLEKTLMMGNTEGKRRKGCQRIRWSDSITDSMNMNLSKLWKIMENRGSWYATVLEVTKSWTWLSNWTASCHYVTGYRPSKNVHVFVVQSLSHVQLFVTPWTATH